MFCCYNTVHTGDTVTFMAWHTVQETLKLTGKSRSQLYRDMAKGLVSYRTGKNDRREFETSELIRAYGELRTSETPKGFITCCNLLNGCVAFEGHSNLSLAGGKYQQS